MARLIPVQVPGLTFLTADDTRRIAADLIGDNKQAITTVARAWGLRHFFRTGWPGAFSRQHSLLARQLRGGDAGHSHVHSGVCRAAHAATSFGCDQPERWHCAGDGAGWVGQVVDTGRACWTRLTVKSITTSSPLKNPIEFLHNHKCSTIHQRELHSDTPNFAHALRSAMRQAPKVILGGRDARPRDH